MAAKKRLEVDLRDGSGRVIKFEAPVNATPTQIGVLAMRAIKQAVPGQAFQRPRLDREVHQGAKVFDAKLSATPDTLRNRVGNKARLMARGVGFSDERANQIAARTEGAADFVPGIGDAIGADDAQRAFKRGDYGEAAIGALATSVGLMPGLGDAAGAGMKAMFLGAKAKTADKAKLATARRMTKAGADKREIWEKTGWFQQHGQWKFEISDKDFKLSPNSLAAALRDPEGASFRTVAEHAELEAAYPGISDRITVAPEFRPKNEGSWDNANQRLNLRAPSTPAMGRTPYLPEDTRSVAAHELQHAVEDIEGFPRGSPTQNAPLVEKGERYERLIAKANALTEKYNFYRTPGPNYDLAKSDTFGDEIEDLHGQAEMAAQYEGYRRSAGETEARNVQSRLNGTMEQRMTRPPWETQEYPDDEQIVRFGGDGAAASIDARAYRGLRGPLDEERRGVEYWTPDREAASDYAYGEEATGNTVLAGQVKLNNPYELTDDDSARGLADMLEAKWDYNPYWDLADHPKARETLQAKGYDGIVMPDSTGGRDHDTYITFDPAQTELGFKPAASADDPLAAKWTPSKEAKSTARQLATMPGGPTKKMTTRSVMKGSEDYIRQAEQGAGGADWYEQSGRSIMSHAGDVEPQAVRLAGGIGVTSAGTSVLPNLEHGVRGHWQRAMGEPVKTGKFPTAMGNDINKIYDAPDMNLQQLRERGDEAFGPKRTPFIQQNLMYEGMDAGHQSSARAVHDIWDMRARGYTNPDGSTFSGTPGAAPHRWSDLQDQGYLLPEMNRREVGGRSDWDTGRAQAAAWVGNKIDSLMAKGKTFEEAQSEAVTDYSHGFDRLYANHSWESAPGSNTGHMSGFDDLPWDQRAAYHEDTKQAFLDSEGRSKIALGYEGLSGKSYDTTGLYEGVMSPGTQDRIPVARGTGVQGLDSASEGGMNAIAATQGLLGAQKGAAWNYQSPMTSTWKGATGVNFDMGRTLTPEDIERYGPAIQARFPAGNVGLLPDANGMRIAKFWDEPGDDLAGFVQELRRSDPALANARPTTQSGNYMENAWDAPEGRFGGQYVDQLQSLNIPEIGRKFDSFAPQIANRIVTDIDPRMMRDAGLSGSDDIERMRKTIANEGWGGLVRLIESTRGSAEAKTALLASVAGIAGISTMKDDPTDF